MHKRCVYVSDVYVARVPSVHICLCMCVALSLCMDVSEDHR